MRNILKFLAALAVALLLMLAFRALVFTIYTVDGNGLEPEFYVGDRIMVNRWSYGLRTGDNRLFPYGRLGRRPVRRGDLVVFDNPADPSGSQVLVCRCTAVPGDTVRSAGHTLVVPGVADCADEDFFWMEHISPAAPADSRQFGFVGEHHIIGRAFLIVFNHDPAYPFWNGYDANRFFRLKAHHPY